MSTSPDPAPRDPSTERRDPGPRRRWARVVGSVLALALAASAGWAAAAVSLLEDPERLYQVFPSPRGAHELVVTYVDPWVFGPHRVRASVRSRDFSDPEPTRLLEFRVANDGASLGAGSCTVRWPGPEVAVLTCTGQEQEPRAYTFDLEGRRLVSTTDPDLRAR